MTRLVAITCLLALLACEDRSEPASEAASSSDQTPAEPVSSSEKEGGDQQVITAMPQPINEFITKRGTLAFGPLTVEVVEKDGKVFCDSKRLIQAHAAESGPHYLRWSTSVGSGFDFTHDPESQWFVYVHTTHDIWAYGGGGWLTRGTFQINPDGTYAGEVSRLTIGDRWMPSAELLASMPQPLIDKIDEIVKRGG